MIFSMFTSVVEATTNKRDEETGGRRIFRRKKLPTARNSSGSSFARGSLYTQNSHNRNSYSAAKHTNSGMPSAVSLKSLGLGDLGLGAPTKSAKKYAPSHNSQSTRPSYSSGPRPSGRPGQFVRGPQRAYGRRGPFGYYRGGFPYWITSYAMVMYSLEECPSFHHGLGYGQKVDGMCMMLCDREHCIQTINYCCFYVEPSKLLVVAAKK